jgi:hypothetical protein
MALADLMDRDVIALWRALSDIEVPRCARVSITFSRVPQK